MEVSLRHSFINHMEHYMMSYDAIRGVMTSYIHLTMAQHISTA